MNEHSINDYLDFTEASILDSEWHKNQLRLTIRKLAILGGYVDFKQTKVFKQCQLIYHDVTKSVQNIYEYQSVENNSILELNKSQRQVVSEFPTTTDIDAYTFYISTYMVPLNGWVDWEIIASSIEIIEITS